MDKIDSKIQSKDMDLFCKAILQLKNMEECYKFFEDIATINEVKASTATISRVNRCLNYGSDGYNIVLNRLKDK